MSRPGSRALRITGLAVALLSAFPVASAFAQSSITVSAGTTPAAGAPGTKITVPIVIDLTNAGALNIASLQTGLSWNPASLTFDSLRVVGALGWAFFSNITAAASGTITFNAFNSTALATTATLANAYFTTAAGSGTRVVVGPISAGDANGTSILSSIRAQSLDVCVGATVKWGDVNASGTVDILDAQQVTRFAAGLSVANPVALAQRGDVNASGGVDVIDAQQIARFSVGLSAAARTGTTFVPVSAPTSVNVNPSSAQTLSVGAAAQIVSTPVSGGNDLTGCSPVTWSSSSPAVAVVNNSGYVTGVSPGATNIIANAGGNTAQVAFTVQAVPVASIAVSLGAPGIQIGATTTATATVFDASNNVLSGRPITFTSSNSAIATVNAATGVVTGVAAGSATIFASSGGVTGAATVSVTSGAPVATVTVSLGQPSVQAPSTTQATGVARDAGNAVIGSATFTWSSSNPAVASVNAATGLVTGVSAGTANIIGTSGGIQGQATVTVTIPPVVSLTVSLISGSIPIAGTTVASAVARDVGNNVINGVAVTWSSSNAAIASVNPATGVVTGVALGTATIFATSGAVTGQATVTVAATGTVSSVTVTLGSPTIQASTTTTAAATARDASNNIVTGQVVVWSSSNPSVATVNSVTGTVLGVGAGSANIIATIGAITGQATVTIGVPVATVSVNFSLGTVQALQTTSASATTKDAGNNVLNGRIVTWLSGNTSIATVSATGVVTGVNPGTANIIALSEGVTGQATVTIIPVPVAQVAVSLGTSSLLFPQTTQATAVTTSAASAVLTGRVITWASSNTAVATVNANTGVVTGVSTGTSNIIATSEGISGQATLTVAPAPVATVTVNFVGPLTQFSSLTPTVQTFDSQGNLLTGRVIAWSSSNTAVATVNAGTGVAYGLLGGTINVVAVSEGKTGSKSLTVVVPPNFEPAGMTVIDDRPMNCQKPTSCEVTWRYAENILNGMTIVTDTLAPRSPNNVAQMNYPAGFVSGTTPAESERIFTNQGTTLYLSTWIKISANWQGHLTGTNKMIHLWINGSNRVYTEFYGSGNQLLAPSVGLQGIAAPYPNWFNVPNTGVDLFPNISSPPNTQLPQAIPPVTRGVWHHYEYIFVANTAGVADGSVEMWMDGAKIMKYTNIMFTGAGGHSAWEELKWSPTWGGGGDIVASNMTMQMDHIYISFK